MTDALGKMGRKVEEACAEFGPCGPRSVNEDSIKDGASWSVDVGYLLCRRRHAHQRERAEIAGNFGNRGTPRGDHLAGG